MIRSHALALACVALTTLLSAVRSLASASEPPPRSEVIQPAESRPNIVWIVIEDMSPHFRCYGETTIETPNLDRLANGGIRFDSAFVTSPVCSTSRSALITGMAPTTIGAHHHRSGRGSLRLQLPDPIVPLPEQMRQAGYRTFNTSWPMIPATAASAGSVGKTDYNFDDPRAHYDGVDWHSGDPSKPFFLQIQLHGGKLREGANWAQRSRQQLGSVTDPQSVQLPPYYPDDPVIRQDWAAYLDTVRETDRQVGEILHQLESENLLPSTVIFLLTDHGISHARGKQFCYDEGIRIALLAQGPGLPAGQVRDDLIAHIDLTATTLALAHVTPPDWMQGRDLFADDFQPRPFVVSARDRCDETVDRIRSVRTDRWKYIRNAYPERPHLAPSAYKDAKPIVARIRELGALGQLDPIAARLLAPNRPREELYDLQADPWEINNLAENPAYSQHLLELRQHLDRWIEETGDQGAVAESPERYDADMAVYVETIRRHNPDQAAIIQANIAIMKAWAASGK